jgi:hypothetical protein
MVGKNENLKQYLQALEECFEAMTDQEKAITVMLLGSSGNTGKTEIARLL